MSDTIPADGPMWVYFGNAPQQIPIGHALPWAMITPDHRTWNDYGYGLFARVWIKQTNGELSEQHLHIMFDGFGRSSRALDEILAQSPGKPIDIETLAIPFVSLLSEATDYRTIIETLGFASGVSLLRKIRDANVVRLEATDAAALELIGREAFHVGILRSAYGAFTRGARYLRPQLPSDPVEITGTYDFSAQLMNADTPHELELNFTPDPIFRDRACVLIGRNGAGKTQLFKAIVDGLRDDLDGGGTFEPPLQVSRVLVFSSVPSDPYEKGIPAWRGIDYEYFSVNASTEGRSASLIGSLLTCWRDNYSPLPDGNKRWSRHSAFLDMLKILGISNNFYLPLRAPEQGEQLPHVVTVGGMRYFPYWRTLNEQGELRLSHRLDWDSLPVVLTENLERRALSSGEHALLRLSAQMVASIEPGSLLLLDEPETHLHPNFVSELMTMVHSLLEQTKSAAIIATHSAYIVREVGRTKVNVISVDDGTVECSSPRMQTFGASIDSISQFVFGDAALEHRFQQSLDRWLSNDVVGLSIEAIISQYGSQLNSEALSLISRLLREKAKSVSE